jgi:hypothetical protein
LENPIVKTSWSRLEKTLLAAAVLLVLVAWLAPGVTQPEGYHQFADRRALGGIPHALNVLSNIPFAIGGAWGLLVLWRTPRAALLPVERWMAAVFFAGLVLTSFCSGWYHWMPADAGLALDRLGMAVAFAGLLGLAAADRISARAGLAAGVLLLLLGPLAVAAFATTGNVLPWALLQFGGMALVLLLLLRRPVPGAMGVPIGAVLFFYALAKVFELLDLPIYTWTGGVLSGHSLKHLVAALAAWPVVLALHRITSATPHNTREVEEET